MMANIGGSYNSRFYYYHEGNELALFRDEYLCWRRKLPFTKMKVLSVSNNGVITLLSEDGIYNYPQAADGNPEFIERYSRESLKKHGSSLGKIMIEDEGNKFLIECTTHKKAGLEHLLAKSGTKKSADFEYHVNLLDLGQKRHVKFYDFTVLPELEKKFLWSSSKTLGYFIVVEPRKSGSRMMHRISMIHVATEEIYSEFEIKEGIVSRVEVNDNGTALVEVLDGDNKRVEIRTLENEHFTLSVPRDHLFLHLGKKFVAFRSHPAPSLIVKSFEDNLLCNADLGSMVDLKITYCIVFNAIEHLDFVYVNGNEIRVVKTEIDHFITEARRWQRMAAELKDMPLKEIRQQQEEEAQKARKEEHQRQKKQELVGHLQQRVDEKKTKKAVTKGKSENILEELRFQYILGHIDEDEYLRRKDEMEAGDQEEKKPGPEKKEPEKGELEKQVPEKRGHLDISPKKPPEKGPKAPVEKVPKAGPASSAEAQKIENLLSKLEERFIMGEISEGSYLELKQKYEKKLQDLN